MKPIIFALLTAFSLSAMTNAEWDNFISEVKEVEEKDFWDDTSNALQMYETTIQQMSEEDFFAHPEIFSRMGNLRLFSDADDTEYDCVIVRTHLKNCLNDFNKVLLYSSEDSKLYQVNTLKIALLTTMHGADSLESMQEAFITFVDGKIQNLVGNKQLVGEELRRYAVTKAQLDPMFKKELIETVFALSFDNDAEQIDSGFEAMELSIDTEDGDLCVTYKTPDGECGIYL
jgi:hypothetical protein